MEDTRSVPSVPDPDQTTGEWTATQLLPLKWYFYHDIKHYQRVGPCSLSQLRDEYRKGYLVKDSRVCCADDGNFKLLSDFPEITSNIPSIPSKETMFTDPDGTTYKWEESVGVWISQEITSAAKEEVVPTLDSSDKRARETETGNKEANSKIVVTGLPADSTIEEVNEVFSKCGEITESRKTSANSTHITYHKATSADFAIKFLHETPLRHIFKGCLDMNTIEPWPRSFSQANESYSERTFTSSSDLLMSVSRATSEQKGETSNYQLTDENKTKKQKT